MLPALIFDLDGTLWDACVPVGESWTAVLAKRFGADFVVSPELARSQMGKTMEEIGDNLIRGYPIDPEEKEGLLKECFDYETEYLKDHPGTLFPQEIETLCALKDQGYPLYIVSNCQSGYIENFLAIAPSLFIDHMCFSDTNAPKDVTIRALMQRNGIEKAIYIGDTEKDEEAAHKAGIPFLHADYGFGSAVSPEGVATYFAEIPKQIAKICGDFKWELPEKQSEELPERLISKYLTATQVEMIRTKVTGINEEELKAAHIEVVTLADSFVRANKKADPEYDAFYTYFQSLISVNSAHYKYDRTVMMVMPLVFILVFFQYLVLIGVYTEADMAKMAVPFPGAGAMGSSNPTA